MQRSVAFHGHNAIRDHEMCGQRAVDIQDAPVDPLPMENVFRPAIDRAGDGAEHVFQAERHARPMVRLHLCDGWLEI